MSMIVEEMLQVERCTIETLNKVVSNELSLMIKECDDQIDKIENSDNHIHDPSNYGELIVAIKIHDQIKHWEKRKETLIDVRSHLKDKLSLDDIYETVNNI